MFDTHYAIPNWKPMNRAKEPLYRKVNTKAYRVFHDFGSDFKKVRNAKRETLEQNKGYMARNKRRGLDYTPLYRFLISKVGKNWDDIYAEARSRLDKPDPIFHLVALEEEERRDYVRTDETTYFSGLFVDNSGVLQLCNPELTAKDMVPRCNCCTHTFNGKVFGSE